MTVIRRFLLAALLVLIAGGPMGCQTSTSVLRQRGELAYKTQRYAAAEDYMLRVHDRQPQDWVANYYLGKLALREGAADAARTYLEVAYTLRAEGPPTQPETYDIVDALAEAIYQQGDSPRLMGFVADAAQRYGRVADYIRKARYLERLGDHDAALVAYRTAIRVGDGRDAAAYVALADFYDALGDRDAAVTQLRHAYALAPADEAIHARLRSHGLIPGPTLALPPTNGG